MVFLSQTGEAHDNSLGCVFLVCVGYHPPEAPPPPELPPPPEKPPELPEELQPPEEERPEVRVKPPMRAEPLVLSCCRAFWYQAVRPMAILTVGKATR